MDLNTVNIDLKKSGKHLNAKQFNELVESPETLLS